METYQCSTCGKTVEIEKTEILFGDSEAYDFDQCQKCFDKENEENEKAKKG